MVGVMPKETIKDCSGTYDVRVGWRAMSDTDFDMSGYKPGDVQVGVETATEQPLVTMLYGQQRTLQEIGRAVRQFILDNPNPNPVGMPPADEVIGREILKIVQSSEASPGQASYVGIWSTLDRAGCDRLVDTVKRARNQAFGKEPTAEQLLADRGVCGARVIITRPSGETYPAVLGWLDGPGAGLATIYVEAANAPNPENGSGPRTVAHIDMWPGQETKGEIVEIHDALTGQRYGGEYAR